MKKLKWKLTIVFILSLYLVNIINVMADDCVHEWGEWYVGETATCSQDGKQFRTCSLCNKQETQTYSDPDAHVYYSYSEKTTVQATCTTDGTGTKTCAKCSHVTYLVYEALGHSWNSGNVTTAAGCETTGVRTYTCYRSGCTETKTESIPATGHDWSDYERITKAATCTATGVKEYSCYNTGCDKKKTEIIPATGHRWADEWYAKVTKKATCTTAGSKEYSCYNTDCDEKKTEVIPATGHNWSDERRVIKEATCTESGYSGYVCLNYCGEIKDKQDIAKLQHDWELIDEKEAKCKKAGYNYYECVVCNEGYEETIKEKGHKWSKWKEVKSSTPYKEGLQKKHCKRDGCSAKKTKAIPKLKKKKCKVKFYGNGGTVKNKSVYAKKYWGMKDYGKLPTPKREGYKFLGWYTKKSGGKKINTKSEVPYGGSIKLYAHWFGPKGEGSTITKSEFKRLKFDMTYSEVCYLIGGKGTLTYSYYGTSTYKTYVWDGLDGYPWSYARLSFKDGYYYQYYYYGLRD